MAESDGNAGSWMMTYADFITLMMIFFIVLYTMTPGVERSKFEAIIGVFQGKQGVLEHSSVISNKTPSLKRKRADNWSVFEQMIKENNLEDEVQLKMLPSGVRITLGEAVTFDTYSAALIPDSYQILKGLAHAIEKYEHEPLEAVEVFGHTDNRPVINPSGKYPSNWELGAARAISVVKFLAANGDIAQESFEASTPGPYHPRVSNDTKEGRRKNRRVEIFVRYAERETKNINERLPENGLTQKINANQP